MRTPFLLLVAAAAALFVLPSCGHGSAVSEGDFQKGYTTYGIEISNSYWMPFDSITMSQGAQSQIKVIRYDCYHPGYGEIVAAVVPMRDVTEESSLTTSNASIVSMNPGAILSAVVSGATTVMALYTDPSGKVQSDEVPVIVSAGS